MIYSAPSDEALRSAHRITLIDPKHPGWILPVIDELPVWKVNGQRFNVVEVQVDSTDLNAIQAVQDRINAVRRMRESTSLQDWTIHLKHVPKVRDAAVAPPPDFLAIVNASDRAGAEIEAARLVATLNNLVEVIEITPGSARHAPGRGTESRGT